MQHGAGCQLSFSEKWKTKLGKIATFFRTFLSHVPKKLHLKNGRFPRLKIFGSQITRRNDFPKCLLWLKFLRILSKMYCWILWAWYYCVIYSRIREFNWKWLKNQCKCFTQEESKSVILQQSNVVNIISMMSSILCHIFVRLLAKKVWYLRAFKNAQLVMHRNTLTETENHCRSLAVTLTRSKCFMQDTKQYI